MPTFKNISEVLEFTGGDTRFMTVALPYGFNHWSEGARQLREDNPDFFEDHVLDSTQDIGVLAAQDGEGRDTVRGWMAIFPGSRYVCTDWRKRLGTPTTTVQADILGIAVRKGLMTLRGGK